MEAKTVFVIMPLGEKDSEAREHATKMLTRVFDKLGENSGYSFNNILTASRLAAGGAENVFKHIKDADIVIADMVWNNLNVFYEIGLAHSLFKPVILIGPTGYEPPFDIKGLLRIEYDKYNFDDNNRDDTVIKNLKSDLNENLEILKKADESKLPDYLAYSKFLTKNTPEVISTYNNVITDLKKLIDEAQSKDNVFTEYIEGEGKAFNELTIAVKSARESILTTRFSPYTVKGKQNTNEFYQTIKQIMNKDQENYPKELQRIIATNAEEKLEEVLDLVRCNIGNNFTIYLSRQELNFEIVIIDKEKVFIHFKRKNDGQDTNKLVSATLKVMNPRVATEFEEIFRSIVKNASYTIRCNDFKNIGDLEKEIISQFKDGLKHCRPNAKNIDNNTTVI